jgi:predicted nucleic acid-binding protein
MRKLDTMLKEYVAALKYDDIKLLADRLESRLHADLPEAINLVSENEEINHWLRSAKSCDELYDMVDTMQEYVDREYSKRASDIVRR